MWWWLLIFAVVVGLVLATWVVSRMVSRRAPRPDDLDRFRTDQAASGEARERRRRAQSDVAEGQGPFMPGA
jgi:membrane protein implicated in regulation of membrane protease activity